MLQLCAYTYILASASTSKKVRGRTRGLELAKIRGPGKRVKLCFSIAVGQQTNDENDDLTRYTTELGVIVWQFAPLKGTKWKTVPKDAKDRLIAYIRASNVCSSCPIWDIRISNLKLLNVGKVWTFQSNLCWWIHVESYG